MRSSHTRIKLTNVQEINANVKHPSIPRTKQQFLKQLMNIFTQALSCSKLAIALSALKLMAKCNGFDKSQSHNLHDMSDAEIRHMIEQLI